MEKWPDKDPNDDAPYGLKNWRAHLGGGDFVASASWTIVPAGDIPLGSATVSTDGDATAVRLGKGGVVGQTYIVTCHAITDQGAEFDRSGRVTVLNR